MTPDTNTNSETSSDAFSVAIPAVLPLRTPSVSAASSETAKRNRVVLVVDDEQVTRLKLEHLLSGSGYTVMKVSNGLEAVNAVRSSTQIDLVLMDINMPDMDGLRALRFIRQLHPLTRLPVIMMTASDDKSQILESFDYGANDYVQKPLDNQVVLARMRTQEMVADAHHALHESEQRYALASLGTNDGIWDWNLKTGELYLSPRWRAMVGMEDKPWNPVGDEWMELIHHEDRRRVQLDLESHLMGETTHFETELRMQDRDREFRWMLCRGMVIRDHMDLPDRIAGSLTDITEGKVADGLTGLPNRVLFSERVDRCVEQLYRRPGWAFSIIYMDMDDFKLINDNFGHEAGDQFLINVAKRLESVLRRSDAIIARLGGDEFAVLIEDTPSETNAIAIAERIDEQMRSPIQVGDREVLTRASMGIAVAPAAHSWPEDQPRLTGEMLLSRADIAMYRAKKQSEIPWCVFEPEMLAENTTRLELGGELKYAIERNELSVEYQPIVELQGGAPLGFEALLRWKHPVHGNVSPARFIPIAEGNGLIVEIGKWVLREACRQVAKWQSSNLGAVSVSVNVSVRQLVAEGFLEAMTNIVAEAGLSPSQLRLEVTESLLMQNPEATISLLQRIRDAGFKIGIDDFGTGYSSLSYLHQMPIDVLKIDRSFVVHMLESKKHHAIIRTIIALANSLDLAVIAEGVETAEQLNALAELGCQYAQGYLISRPATAERATEILQGGKLGHHGLR